MKTLIAFSRRYGADMNLVIAGGGNTSMKENGVLAVKRSGCALKDADESSFVKLDIQKLLAVLDKAYPEDDALREAAYLKDVLDARLPGEEEKRPSVEALLHALFPQKYVLHLHPALINGLTCAKKGREEAKRMFGSGVLWVPACKPGYTLAKQMNGFFRGGGAPDRVLLENHGVFFAADTASQLDNMLNDMLAVIQVNLKVGDGDPPYGPFTPDQLVYCGPNPQVIGREIVAAGENARLLFEDAKKIAAYAKSFGGPKPLAPELVDFIVGWEAESYRKSQQ